MNKHKITISLFVFLVILLLPNCAIKKRVEATPMPTHIEKPPELLWQDATRFLRNKNYTEAASTFEEIDKQHPYSKLAKQGQVMSAYTYYISKNPRNITEKMKFRKYDPRAVHPDTGKVGCHVSFEEKKMPPHKKN